MATKKIISEGRNLKEFASVDGQSVLPDPVVGGDAARAADQSGGETTYDMTTKAEVMASILNDLAGRSAAEVMDVFKNMTANPAATVRPADKTAGETGIIRLSPTSVDTSAAMESVSDIFTGQEISEDLKVKAATIFEATVNARISIIETRLEEQYTTALEEAIDVVQDELVEQVDKYVSYVAKMWLDANKIAVDQGIKSQMAENIIQTLKDVFEENYINVAEEKLDVLESVNTENETLKARLNESLKQNIELTNMIEQSTVKDLVAESAVGLTVSQKEKFLSLVENLSYETVNDLKTKIDTIKETYFTGKSTINSGAQPLTEDVSGENDETQVSPSMKMYVNALSRTLK